MKLRTSFFNWTALRKDITRFAPVWGLYTVFMLMFVLLVWDNEGSGARFVTNASSIMKAMSWVNLIYAGLCAVLLFGDLFKSQMCNALHAMPMRREGWFLTHLAAGLLFCVVPNTLGCLITAMLLQQYCYGAFLWLGVTVLQYLFFFAVGIFGIMCAGNRLGAVAVYGIINFFSVLAAWLVQTFYEPLLYGVKLNMDGYARMSPVLAFMEADYVGITYDNMTESAKFHGFVPEDWRYLWIAAAVGVVLTVLALLIYRRRRLETAGDFMAVKPASPVFLVIYTLCVGAVMYFVADMTAESLRYIFLVIGLAIGFFTGRMLLEKRVNVFRKNTWIGFGALLVVFALSIGLTWMDPFGITRYVPEAEQVWKVRFSPYSSQFYFENESITLIRQEDIESITKLHAQLEEERSIGGDSFLWLQYEMKNGTVIDRQYYLDADSEVGQALKQCYSTPESVFKMDDPEAFLEKAYLVEFHSFNEELPYVSIATETGLVNVDLDSMKEKFGEEEVVQYVLKGSFGSEPIITGLMEAIRKDCEAGTMAQIWEYHQDQENCGYLIIQAVENRRDSGYVYSQTKSVNITVYEDCVNTIAYLRSLSAE